MAKKRSALGRGLAELLGGSLEPAEASPVPDAGTPALPAPEPSSSSAAPVEPAHGLAELPVGSIRPNPRQPRRVIEPEALEELARSIAAAGLVQPVIVRPAAEGYELIAGERRWRAAQLAGFTVIPAIVRPASDTESLELALIENVVRQQLNAIDEAYALQVLRDDLGVTQEALASRVGKSRSAIANKIRLLDLPHELQDLLVSGELSEGHGRALLGLTSRGEQLRLGRKAVRQGMSVRAVEAAVRAQNDPSAKARKAGGDHSASAILPAALLDEVRDRFYGTLEVLPVVRTKGPGGRIEIAFKDRDDLRRILDRLEP